MIMFFFIRNRKVLENFNNVLEERIDVLEKQFIEVKLIVEEVDKKYDEVKQRGFEVRVILYFCFLCRKRLKKKIVKFLVFLYEVGVGIII